MADNKHTLINLEGLSIFNEESLKKLNSVKQELSANITSEKTRAEDKEAELEASIEAVDGKIPTAFVKTASASGNTLTLTLASNSIVTFNNTTYSEATTSSAGLLSATDKAKLDNLATIKLEVLDDTEYNSSTGEPTIANPASNFIYLVPDNTDEGAGSYIEWLYVENAWERIGTTATDLSGYVQGSIASDTDIVNMMNSVKNPT